MIYFLTRINKWSNNFLFNNYFYLLQYTNQKHLYKRTITYLKSVFVIFLVFCVFLLCVPLRFPHKTMFGSSLPPVVLGGAHVLFMLFVFFLVWWCPTHIALCFCFVCLRLVYPLLSVLWIVPFWLHLRYSLTFIYLHRIAKLRLMPSMSEGLYIYIA